jgi:hypothetical protein
MIGMQQHRRMESSSASAPLVRALETIKTAGRVAERETKASDQLRTPEGRGE